MEEEENNIIEESAEESKKEESGLFDVKPNIVGIDPDGNPVTYTGGGFVSGPSNDEVLKPFGLPKFIEIKGEKLLTTDFLLDTYGYKPYLPGDDIVELDKFVTKKDVETLQDQLKAAGYLKDGSYTPKLKDEKTVEAFQTLLGDANQDGGNWKNTLTFILTNPKYDVSDLPDKLELDYADLTNKVINTVKSAVGRTPTNEELDILTDILAGLTQEQYEGELSNAEIAIQPKYREEEIMLEGRATGQTRLVETTPSGFVTPSNAEAKFEAKVQELFKPEMDLNQRREQTRNVANIIKSSVAGLGSIGG